MCFFTCLLKEVYNHLAGGHFLPWLHTCLSSLPRLAMSLSWFQKLKHRWQRQQLISFPKLWTWSLFHAFIFLIISLLIKVINPQVDPFLELVDDIQLQAVCIKSEKIIYGSQEDEVAAVKSLSAVELNDNQLKETVISYFMTKFSKLSKVIWICLGWQTLICLEN